MSKCREWILQQLRLGNIQELFSYLVLAILIFIISKVCAVIVRDAISTDRSIFYIISVPIIFFSSCIMIVCLLISHIVRLQFILNTNIDNGVRFDRAKDMLGIISNEDMLEFVQKHNLNKYISDIELIHSDFSNTNGKLDTLPSSFLLKYDGIHRLIGQHRVFFRKNDIEALQEKYSINLSVANDDYTAAELQKCRLEIRSMTDEKDELVNRLKRETGLRTAANAQAAERKQSNHLERVRILLAMKVAIRLTKSYDDKVPYTRRRIREALADELGPGKEFEALGGEFEKELKTKLEMKPRKKAHGSLVDEPGPEKKLEMLWEKLENKLEKSVPNFLVELVRDGLPGMVKQEKGAPLKII